jgi:hypothetical protein
MSKPKRPKAKLIKGNGPRRCIVCAQTKEAKEFSKTYVYVCERCVEKK